MHHDRIHRRRHVQGRLRSVRPGRDHAGLFRRVTEHLAKHGRPLAYYSDRHSIFRVNGEVAEPGPTQLERALKTLGIELICAHSPQAKGRVERVHQTLQDRFTKALRLAGISDIEAANTLLQSYLPTHNARFAEPPLDPEDAHRSTTLDHADLRRILSHHHVRTVDKHGAIRFERRALHIDANHRRRTVGKRLTVITTDDKIELWHGQTPVPFTTFDITTWHARVSDRKELDAALDQSHPLPRSNLQKPARDHPWRQPATT